MKMSLRSSVLLILMLILSQTGFADAIVNGGFETGTLNGWDRVGDVAAVGTINLPPYTVHPTEGSFQAALGNGPTDAGNCSLTPGSCFTFSGNRSLVAPFVGGNVE